MGLRESLVEDSNLNSGFFKQTHKCQRFSQELQAGLSFSV